MEKMVILFLISLLGSIYSNPIDKNEITDDENYNDLDWNDDFYDSLSNDTQSLPDDDIFSADMILNDEQKKLYYNDLEENAEENIELDYGLKNTRYKWPKKTVVYHIKPGQFKKREIGVIKKNMQTISNLSCVKFRKRTKRDRNYVQIQAGSGCSADVGFQGGVQHLNLNRKGCIYHETILHELLHVLGFHHMQNHPKRDRYVRILWRNIKFGKEHNFFKRRTNADYGGYDYSSIMHYDKMAFSRNGRPTIKPLKNVSIGQAMNLSRGDVYRLKKMYKC